jgi:hypothetical protein
MKSSLRLTLQIIMVIFGLFFLIPVFLPSAYTVTATKEIHAPAAVIFHKINHLKTRKTWSPFEQDPTMKIRYEGPQEGVGAKSIWKSQRSGNGTLEITQATPYRSLKTVMNFSAPGKVTGEWTLTTEEDHTKVSWKLHIKGLQYPFGKWVGILLRKSMKQILESGLDALKIVSEKKTDIPPVRKK